jgi:hypothetical protein
MGAGILPERIAGKGSSAVKSPDEIGTISENMSPRGLVEEEHLMKRNGRPGFRPVSSLAE